MTQVGQQNCIMGAIYDNITKTCQCPQDKPYNDTAQCLNCYAPSFWNETIKRCDDCEDGKVYNTQTKSCV